MRLRKNTRDSEWHDRCDNGAQEIKEMAVLFFYTYPRTWAVMRPNEERYVHFRLAFFQSQAKL